MSHDQEGPPALGDSELFAEFDALFPSGWAGADVMRELAPMGWAQSPLVALFHPSAAQVYEESVRIHRNLSHLRNPKSDVAPPPAPTFEEIAAEHRDAPVEAERECQELVGQCLWDIFSDNHEVSDAEGRLLELGSMRASGGFLAEVLNRQGGPPPTPRPEPEGMFAEMFNPPGASPEHAEMLAKLKKEMFGDGGYAYLDFYMGTQMIAGRADLSPVYEMIFRRLRARGMTWKYTFPRLYAVDMRPLSQALEEKKRQESGEPEWADYDPAAELEKEQEDRKRDQESAELRESLDEAHREAVEASRDQEPPTTVRAYRTVYGEFPEGWPPEA